MLGKSYSGNVFVISPELDLSLLSDDELYVLDFKYANKNNKISRYLWIKYRKIFKECYISEIENYKGDVEILYDKDLNGFLIHFINDFPFLNNHLLQYNKITKQKTTKKGNKTKWAKSKYETSSHA